MVGEGAGGLSGNSMPIGGLLQLSRIRKQRLAGTIRVVQEQSRELITVVVG